MALTFPRDVVVEMYLAGTGWVDITTYVRQTEPLTISRGSSDEQSNVAPTKFTALLDNTSGRFNIDNPMSPYYGLLSRNTPIRMSLRVALDSFDGRTVANGWGSASSTGDAWSVSSTTSRYAVASGLGTQSVTATNTFTSAWLAGLRMRDAWVRSTFKLPFANTLSGNVEPGTVLFRYVDTNNFYMVRPVVLPSEVVQLVTLARAGGVEYTLDTVTTSVVNTGANMTIVAQIEGETIRGKIFTATDVEPYAWDITTHNNLLAPPGAVGIRSGVAFANTNTLPVVFSYDSFEARDIRVTGELAEIRPRLEPTHTNKVADLTVAGISRRLGSSNVSSLESAPRRYLTSNLEFTATDFWPLDELTTAPIPGLNAIAGGSPARFDRETGVVPNRGAVTWGVTDETYLAVPAVATLSNGGRLVFTTQQSALGSAFSFMLAMRLSPDAGAQVFISTAAVANRWAFFLYTDGTCQLFSNPSGGVIASGQLAPGGLGGQWATLGFTATPLGGDTLANVWINGESMGGGSVAADAGYSPLSEILVHVPQPTTGGQGDSAFSTLFVTPTQFDVFTGGRFVAEHAHRAIMGWAGETAGARVYRLCVEEAVSLDYIGTLGTSVPMGPQRPLPFLSLIQECATTDQGILCEPRSVVGLTLVNNRSLLNKLAQATLDYSASQVSPPFTPVHDDQQTVNDVTAERPGGGAYQAEQTVGNLNVNDPGSDVQAVGRHPLKLDVNPETDHHLPPIAEWRLHLGTVTETRFPQVRINLRNSGLTANIIADILGINVGDRLVINNLVAADIYNALDQLVRGYTETITDQYRHEVTVNSAPYRPYVAFVLDVGHLDHDATVLNEVVDTTETGIDITVPGALWTTASGDWPFGLVVGGEYVTATAVSGASSPQVFTVTRSVNGVVKTHAIGQTIRLSNPIYLGM